MIFKAYNIEAIDIMTYTQKINLSEFIISNKQTLLIHFNWSKLVLCRLMKKSARSIIILYKL